MPRPALRAMLAAMALGFALPGLAAPGVDQVAIEARFVEVSRNAAAELGIDWFRPGDGIRTNVTDFGQASGGSTPFANFNLIIDALQADALSGVVANPRIATLDNGAAEIAFGSPVPLPTVDYNQVGIKLTVTPSAVENGVRVRIAIETGGPTLAQGNYVPIVDQRQLDASVLLPTGSALAINNLFPDDAGATAAKVPFLGDIPVLGTLFRSRNYQNGRTKPLAFVFPYTVGSAAGADSEDEPIGPIMVQVAVVETSQSTFENLGIDWLGGQIGTTAFDLGNIAPGAADLPAVFQAFIHAIEANALTQTLAAPNLVSTGDGTSELVIRSPVALPTIDFNKIGFTLRVTPDVTDDDNISLDVIGESGGVTLPSGGNIPAFELREVDTSVLVRNGETVVIGGLFPDDMVEAGDKLPFLGDIPVLGSLFRSDASSNDETELVIIVAPHLIDPSGGSSGSGGSSSAGTTAAQPAQPRSADQQTTSTVATQTDETPAETGQGGRLTGEVSVVASRLDLNGRAGGGVVIYPGFDVFASHGPGSIRMNGFELSINLDLGQPNLFGLPDVVSRLLTSGQPTSRLYASFSHTSGDAQDHFRDSNTELDYGIVFAEEFEGVPGVSFDGAAGAGLDSMTQTESSWFRAAIGIETEFPNLFGNSRLTLEKRFGVFLEKLDTDYDADTVVLFNDVAFPTSGSQTTTASIEDRYLGIMLGKTLFYALTQRLRVGVGGEIYLSHRSSSAEVHQHNVSSLDPPLDNFELQYNFEDSGLAVGLGAALLAEYALNNRWRFTFELRHQSLPGATTLLLPETTSQIPVGVTQESATQRSLLFKVAHDF